MADDNVVDNQENQIVDDLDNLVMVAGQAEPTNYPMSEFVSLKGEY